MIADLTRHADLTGQTLLVLSFKMRIFLAHMLNFFWRSARCYARHAITSCTLARILPHIPYLQPIP